MKNFGEKVKMWKCGNVSSQIARSDVKKGKVEMWKCVFHFIMLRPHRSNYVSKANFSITKSFSPSNRRYGKAMITRIWFKLAQNWFNIASTLAQHWFNIGSTFRYPVFWREKYHYIQYKTTDGKAIAKLKVASMVGLRWDYNIQRKKFRNFFEKRFW